MTICPDCQRADAELWPVYDRNRWCCRARWIFAATISLRRRGISLDDARRDACLLERRAHPADWPAVRARLLELMGE